MNAVNRIAAIALAFGSVAAVLFDAFFLDFFGIFIIVPVAVLPLGLVGALLVARIPRNPVGWLLALAGVLFALMLSASAYNWAAFVRDPGTLPFGDVAAVFANSLFPPALGCLVLMLLYFPSGRGLGGRWTWLERAVALLVITLGAVELFRDAPLAVSQPPTGELSGTVVIANPFALRGAAGAVISALAFVSASWTILIVFLGPASLFVRYRRSSAIERAQIKWLAYAGTIAFALLVSSNFLPGDLSNWLWAAGVVALGLLPIAIGIAILRYRLYDIDRLINRTLVYGALSISLAATYYGGVVLLETALRSFTGASQVSVALSTLVVVALFAPVRSRIQRFVDRRFSRERYDAEQTLAAFGERLRDEIDLEQLRGEVVGVVRQTVRPTSVTLWLRRR